MATKRESGPNGLVNYTRTAHSSYYAKQFIDNGWPVRDDYYYSEDIYVRGFFLVLRKFRAVSPLHFVLTFTDMQWSLWYL